ncbi:hypothetical protein BX666DRAFT_1878914 [Dichotomocladium elegans]|nr:hypothetical protein BX666DRAFT_1878914 [Dichotomocladium elegans]
MCEIEVLRSKGWTLKMNPFRDCLGRSPQPILLPPDDDDDEIQQVLQPDKSDDRSHRSCGLWAITALLPRRSQGIRLEDDAEPSSSQPFTADDIPDPNTIASIGPLLDHHVANVERDEGDCKEFMRRDTFAVPNRFLSRNPFATTSSCYDDDAQVLTDNRISTAASKQKDAKCPKKMSAVSGSSGNGINSAEVGPETPLADPDHGQELLDVAAHDRAEPYKSDWTEMDQEEDEMEEELENVHFKRQEEEPRVRQEPSFPIVGLPRTHFSSAGMANLIIKSESTPAVHDEVDEEASKGPPVPHQGEPFLNDPLAMVVQSEIPKTTETKPEEASSIVGQQQQLELITSAPLTSSLKLTMTDPLSFQTDQRPEVIPGADSVGTVPIISEVPKQAETTTAATSVRKQEDAQNQPTKQSHEAENDTDTETGGTGRRSSVAAVAHSILGDRLDDFTEKLAFIKKNIIMSLEDDDEYGWDEETRQSTAKEQQQQSKRRISLDPLLSSSEGVTTASQVRHKRSSSLMDMAGPSIARFIHQMSGDDHSTAFSPSSFFASLAGPDPDRDPVSVGNAAVSSWPQQHQSNSTGTRQQLNHNHHLPLSSSPSAIPPVVPEEEEEAEEEDNDEEELFDFGKMINMGRTMFSDVANRMRNANQHGNEGDDANGSWTLDRDNWI